MAALIRGAGAVRRAVLSPPGTVPLLTLCTLAWLLRSWLSWQSVGSNDITTWQGFAGLVERHGVVRTYQLDGGFNHPPLMGYWALAALKLAREATLPFPFTFKLLPIAASVATIYGLARAYSLSWFVIGALVLNPADVLVGSYHGNTDTLCTALCVGALIAANRSSWILSGILLGAAINVKLIPVIVIVPLLASLPGFRARLRCLAGLGLGVIPFVPVLFGSYEAFVKNAIMYNSFRAYWGFGMLAYGSGSSFREVSESLWKFAELGKYPIVLGSALYTLLPLAGRRPERAQYFAFPLSTFLVFASGFGPQYLVYPIPFLMVLRPRIGAAYAYLSGAFAFFLYHWYWNRSFPPFSSFNTNWPDMNALMFGFASWCVLTYWWLASLGEQWSAFRDRVLSQDNGT
jgi:hypothetical protein